MGMDRNKLPQSEARRVRQAALVILRPYLDHQGWPGLEAADTGTAELILLLDSIGVVAR